MSTYAEANPLHEAAANGRAAQTAALLASGLDPNVSGIGCLGNTPLHAVVNAFGHTETSALMRTATLLLDAGANPSISNGEGVSATDYATTYAPLLGQLFRAHVRSRALGAGLPSVADWRAARSGQKGKALPTPAPRRPRF
ncbi:MULTISPECIES: ankyrin repeat domain-containing protein [Stenotrophomonas]|uniref:ankyrin repeat domain-containing protein n=1 Tax=Stenotrophomonas TaxID=40323 RepID=UPI0008721B7B|nr:MULTISPECIES: ankyrin repeat domain-containing protein [Stenotrophomonas]OEZ01246.1 hypothetical protein BIY45_07375 [Stenotrophomonas sp. BIIR7]